MVAALSRAGNGGFSFAGERSYDAWGLVRSGGSSGAPSQRYCASLGHVQDDETGLVYMRARYYEPGSGRFVSEDPARDGANWLVYAGNNPANRADVNGQETLEQIYKIALVSSFFAVLGGLVPNAGRMDRNKWLIAGAAFVFRFIFAAGKDLALGKMDDIALDPDKFRHKLWTEGAFSAVLGMSLGAFAAFKLGEYHGRVVYELFYIENWEELA